MSHAVHYRSEEGGTRFEQLGSLDDALARVEQLRNEQGVSEVRVYREVPVTFRAYYKATVAEEGDPTPPPAPEPAPAAQQAADGPAEEPAPTSGAAQASSSPPPGAMPLSPPVPSANGRDDEEEVDAPREGRGSLFGRG